MHVTGQILVWFNAILATVALYFATMVAGTHQSMMAAITKNQAQIDANKTKLADVEREAARLQAEFDRTMLQWERYWPAAQATVDPTTGQVSLQGLTGFTDRYTRVHAFQPNADGTTRYIGEFRTQQATGNAASLAPAWRLRPGDTDGWVAGTWRIRAQIPSGDYGVFVDLHRQLLLLDELHAYWQKDLAVQDELIQFANDHLQYRQKELDGFPELAAQSDKLPTDIIGGVIQALIEQEELRNAALARASALRRRLFERQQEFDAVRKENDALAQNLLERAQPTGFAKARP